jgi:GH35 family endo-1,4-beta-xylanase
MFDRPIRSLGASGITMLALSGPLCAPLPAQNANVEKPDIAELRWRTDGSTVTPVGKSIEFTADEKLPYSGQAWADISARKKTTVRVLASPLKKFPWNNFGILLADKNTGQYVEAGVQAGTGKAAITQASSVHDRFATEGQEGAPLPQYGDIPLELTVDAETKTIVFKIGDWQMTSELKAKVSQINRLGLQSYHTGATFTNLEISGSQPTTVEEMQRAAQSSTPAGKREAQVLAPGSLYAKLKEEFKPVGDAYFVLADSEDEALDRFGVDRAAKMEKVPVTGQIFKRALRVVTSKDRWTDMWDAFINANNKSPIYKGDVLLWTFYARGTKAPQAVDDGAGAVIGPVSWRREPFGFVTWPWPKDEISEEWTRYWVVSQVEGSGAVGGVGQDYAPGKLDFNFMLGYKNQTIEIGGIAVMAFADPIYAKLPQQNWDYFGRDPKAAWRQEANRRIDLYRKENLQVLVRDARGKPVPGADVRIVMKNHAFNFGISVTAAHFLNDKNPQYRENVLKHFNQVVFANDLKWDHMEDRLNGVNAENTLAALKILKANNKRVRGHVLVWPGFQNASQRIRGLKDKPDELRAAILKRVTDTVTTYKDYISDWDVTNETEGNRDYMDILGPTSIVDWYKAARAADPKATLTFNEPEFGDHGMEGGSFPYNKLPQYKGWVDYLIKQGAPLDILGSQAHGGILGNERGNGAYGVWKYYDELVKTYGKPLQYTELDMALKDPNSEVQQAWQADKLRDSLIIAFAHPAVIGAVQWGYWEGDVWLAGSGLWNKDWSLKPNGKAYLDLTTKTWWTDEKKKTDAKGTAATRGFLGSYKITVTANGKTKTVPVELKKGAKTPLVVTLN